jgi:signal transduction histidine kinase
MTLGPSNKTRLGAFIITAMPVTALGVASGAGTGVAPLIYAPVALTVGALLGLLLSRAMVPSFEPVDNRAEHRSFGVRALLSRAAHEARPGLSEVAVRVDVTPARLRTIGDPECLHRALSELIVHAARRSPPGAVVTLAARPVQSGVRLEVVDEGDGDCDTGLAGARRIVGRHGGALRAERALPQGCRVVVELPGA